MSDWVKAYWPRSGDSLSARTVSTSLRTSELNSSSRWLGSMSEIASIAWRGKLPPSTEHSLTSRRSSGPSASSREAMRAVRPGRDLELAELADKMQQAVVTLFEDTLVEQSPHRLDRVERDPLGALDDAARAPRREAR